MHTGGQQDMKDGGIFWVTEPIDQCKGCSSKVLLQNTSVMQWWVAQSWT